MKTLLLGFFIFFGSIVFSQSSLSTSEIYEVKYIKYFKIDDDQMHQHFRNMDPTVKQRNIDVFTEISEFRLFSSSMEAEYHNIGKINNSQSTSDQIQSHGNQVTFANNDALLLYRNLIENYTLRPGERRTFVKDSLMEFTWNTNHSETQEILGFSARKATTEGMEPNTEVVAWYAEDIPMSHGPENYWGLPGLILKIDVLVYDNRGLASFIDSYHFEAVEIQTLDDYKMINVDSRNIISVEKHQEIQAKRQRKLREFNSSGVERMD